MRRYLPFLLIFLVHACKENPATGQKDATDKVDTSAGKIPDSVKRSSLTETDTYILHPTGFKDISRFYDSTINGIIFNNCPAIDSLFGDTFHLLPDDYDLPALQIVNADQSQLLTMLMWNGNAKCHFSQYQVEYASPKPTYLQKPFKLATRSFKSGRNIFLGITPSDLKSKLGLPNETRQENGLTILSYQQYDDLYFGDYFFKANKLVKFRFGFEYP